MHTTKILRSTDFSFKMNGREVLIEDVFPEFNERDRIGIVIHHPCGATGAVVLLMAAVTSFYDFYRQQLGNEHENLRIYPEFFVFHIGQRYGNHRKMDIWPPHREFVVEDSPELILEAVNDRGITRLIVEDIPSVSAKLLPETINSAQHRIRSAMAYSSTGRVNHADIIAESNLKPENYILDTLENSRDLNEISSEDYERLYQMRKKLRFQDTVKETYRRITLTDAIYMLASPSMKNHPKS